MATSVVARPLAMGVIRPYVAVVNGAGNRRECRMNEPGLHLVDPDVVAKRSLVQSMDDAGRRTRDGRLQRLDQRLYRSVARRRCGTRSCVFDPRRYLDRQLVRVASAKEVEDDQAQLRVKARPSHDPYRAPIQRRPDDGLSAIRDPRHLCNFSHVGIVLLRDAGAAEMP